MHIYTYELSLSARGALTNTAAGTLSLAVRRKERRGNVVRWELLRRCRRIARSFGRLSSLLSRETGCRGYLSPALRAIGRGGVCMYYTRTCARRSLAHIVYIVARRERKRGRYAAAAIASLRFCCCCYTGLAFICSSRRIALRAWISESGFLRGDNARGLMDAMSARPGRWAFEKSSFFVGRAYVPCVCVYVDVYVCCADKWIWVWRVGMR